MNYKSIIAAGLISLSVSFTAPQFAFAQSLSDAVEAYDADDYQEALPIFTTLANQGNDDAMWYLGKMYDNGWGTTQSDELAFTWYEKSAKLGDKDAQWEVGIMYEIGQWVAEDQKKAFQWYEKSAENGRTSAMNELGNRYGEGNGVKKSVKKATQWYKKGAEAGNAKAQANLGVAYEYGKGGLRQSDEKALYWYRQSADQGNARGQAYLGEMYESGTGVAVDLAEARRLYTLAAEQDNEYAKKRLAEMGDGSSSSASSNSASDGEMSAEEAIALFSEGMSQSLLQNAARNAQNGNYEKSLELYLKAATEFNSARAQYFVGAHHELGWGTPQNWEKAEKWTRMGAENGSADAQYSLGQYYFKGNAGLSVDVNQGIAWTQKAARNGLEAAQETLSRNGKTW